MTTPASLSVCVPVREEEAQAIIASISDPVLQNLVKLSVAQARMRFMHWSGMSEPERRAQLPVAPFDMAFFAGVMSQIFSEREAIERVLRGESIESATGWDV